MKSRFILEDGRIEWDGNFDFDSEDYKGRILMTNHCNVPRIVVSDEMKNGVRVIKMDSNIHEYKKFEARNER